MPTAIRRRTISAIGLSAVVHAVVFAVLWVQRPTLPVDRGPAGPPEAVIPVLLMPRTPPPAPGARAPAPIRLHRRAQRFAAELPPVAPLQIPEKKAEAEPGPPAAPSPLPPPPIAADVRRALRLGPVGCANAEALGLSPAEREDCDRQLAAGAKEAPYIPPGMSADKRAALQAAGAQKLAAAKRREAQPVNTPPPPSDYDGDPYVSGSGASALGPVTYPPSKRAASKLGRLPP
jgi:hypothetical protein